MPGPPLICLLSYLRGGNDVTGSGSPGLRRHFFPRLPPQNVYVVLDLYGRVTAVSIVSSTVLEEPDGTKPPSVTSEPYSEEEEEEEEQPTPVSARAVGPDAGPIQRAGAQGEPDSSPSRWQCESEAPPATAALGTMEFLENHGKNILLSNGNLTATRVASYNQGIVVIAQPLPPGQLFQVGLPLPVCLGQGRK